MTSGCTVAAGTTFDVRPRAFEVASGVTLTIAGGTATTDVLAGSMLLESGARVIAEGTAGTFGAGGTVRLLADGTITQRSAAVIDATGRYAGGQITIEAGGNVTLEGRVEANASIVEGLGGAVTIASDEGSVLVGGTGIRANGGTKGESGAFGGIIQIAAATNLVIDAPVQASRGDCAFCAIELTAEEGSVVTTPRGEIDFRGSGGFGKGGEIAIDAGTAVEIHGTVLGSAAGSVDEGGGDGGALVVVAATASALLAGPVDVSGAGPDGDGGFIAVDAALDARFVATMNARTEGAGAGGTVLVTAGRSANLESTVDVRGGAFDGGSIDVAGADGVTVLGTAALLADGRNGGAGGQVALSACRLDVRSGALLSTMGPGGAPFAGARLTARGTMTVGGTVRGDVAGGGNVLTSRIAPPQLLPSASITPSATLVSNPALPCCQACPATTTTSTTSTSTSSSTTTSSVASTTLPPSSTSTSVPTSTSSTSTTVMTTSTTSTSTSTTPQSTTTTSTRSALPCADVPAATLQELACRLNLLRDTVDASDPAALGGPKTAKGVRRRVMRAEKQVSLALSSAKPALPLRRVAAELHRLTTSIARAERRGIVGVELSARLRDLTAAASSTVEAVRQRIRSASTVSIDHASHAAANRTNPTSSSL